jgi:hypothetical protein
MTLAAQLGTDLPVFFNTDDFATPVTTSTGAVVKGIIDYSQVLGSFDLNGQATQAVLYLLESEVSTVARYDTFTVAGVVWRVEQVISHDGHVWTLTVSTDRRVS